LYKSLFSLVYILCYTFLLSAQSNVEIADNLFLNKKYSAAQSIYNQRIISGDYNESILFNHAKCSKELFNSDALFLYTKFLNEYPYSFLINDVYTDIALIYYRSKNYSEATKFFKKIDQNLLGIDLQFKLAYCYFKSDSVIDASYYFSKIISSNSNFSDPSRYYLAHILYSLENYDKALENFLKLKTSEKFTSIIPYYIAQIYFIKKDYNKVIELISKMISDLEPSRYSEMNRLLAEAYFHTNDFNNATIYFENYMRESEPSDYDLYLLGLSYYNTSNYQNAIDNFVMISSSSDTLIQYSAYYLGFCYINLNNLNYAMQAFKKSSDLNFNLTLKEESYYNYAKLSYELNLPFDNTLKVLTSYNKIFKRSLKYNEEISSLLVNLYQGSSQYINAYNQLNSLVSLDDDKQLVMQNISCILGVQSYNKQNYNEAIRYFKKSNNFPISSEIYFMSCFWLAESYYKLKDYENAISIHKKIAYISDKKLNEYVINQKYNNAYCYYNTKQYKSAIEYFKIFENNSKDSLYLNDTYLRLADSYFMRKNYFKAHEYYQKTINYSLFDIDYALYKSSIAAGLLNKNLDKVKNLKKIVSDFPNSIYFDVSLYDLANYYKAINNYDVSLKYYNQVIEYSGESNLLSGSYLGKGMLYLNNNEYNKALDNFFTITNKYSKTKYFKEAILGIERAYTSLGKIEDYLVFIESLPNYSLSKLQQDTLIYNTAFIKFSEKNYESANEIFKKYLDDFVEGNFYVDALYYYALSSIELNDSSTATLYYNLILENSDQKYREQSLVYFARKYYNSKNYDLSNKYYVDLQEVMSSNSLKREVLIRLMHGYENINRKKAANYANKVLDFDKKDDWLLSKAYVIIARNAFDNGNYIKSNNLYKKVSLISRYAEGAESMYYIAYFAFLNDSLSNAEKTIFKLADDYHSDHYIAKGFILLSDIYMNQDNAFQAKATLESIITNHDGADLIKLSKKKLKNILDNEQKNKTKIETISTINISENDFEYFFDYDTVQVVNFDFEVLPLDSLKLNNSNINNNLDE
tara:strand:- start:10652 stop:13756 length:3105 start_codon:yes stop_codon:yes gene_type:complete